MGKLKFGNVNREHFRVKGLYKQAIKQQKRNFNDKEKIYLAIKFVDSDYKKNMKKLRSLKRCNKIN